MRQHSLLKDYASLAGLMPAVRAAMRRVVGDPESEGRKALVDSINSIARHAQVRLTGGNSHALSKETLDKILSPSDAGHPPSLLFLVVFALATRDISPISMVLRAVGLDVMTDEDRRFRDIGRADVEMKAARKRKRQLEEML